MKLLANEVNHGGDYDAFFHWVLPHFINYLVFHIYQIANFTTFLSFNYGGDEDAGDDDHLPN